MDLDRAARPVRAGLRGRAVADGDDDSHRRRTVTDELVPALAAVAGRINASVGKCLECERIEPAAGRAAGAERAHVLAELAGPVVQHAFAQHAARGVMGAQDQDVGGHCVASTQLHLREAVVPHSSPLQQLAVRKPSKPFIRSNDAR